MSGCYGPLVIQCVGIFWVAVCWWWVWIILVWWLGSENSDLRQFWHLHTSCYWWKCIQHLPKIYHLKRGSCPSRMLLVSPPEWRCLQRCDYTMSLRELMALPSLIFLCVARSSLRASILFSSKQTLETRIEGSAGLKELAFSLAPEPAQRPCLLDLPHCLWRKLGFSKLLPRRQCQPVVGEESAALQDTGSCWCRLSNSESLMSCSVSITPERSLWSFIVWVMNFCCRLFSYKTVTVKTAHLT